MSTLDDRLAALATMPPAQLRAEWLHLHKSPAPTATPDLLMRGIAHRLQEKAHGGLAPSAARKLERLARQLAHTGEIAPLAETRIKPGTRLVRDWGGASHHVLVLDKGYLYRDRHFGSLSQIAAEITGARWSGPRFFGLTRRGRREAADA